MYSVQPIIVKIFFLVKKYIYTPYELPGHWRLGAGGELANISKPWVGGGDIKVG